MFPVSERNVIRRSVSKLILRPFSFSLAFSVEAQGVKCLRIRVERIVEMSRVGRGGHECTLWDESSVDKCDILHSLAHDGH